MDETSGNNDSTSANHDKKKLDAAALEDDQSQETDNEQQEKPTNELGEEEASNASDSNRYDKVSNEDDENEEEEEISNAGDIEEDKDNAGDIEEDKDNAGDIEEDKDNAGDIEEDKDNMGDIEDDKDNARDIEEDKDKTDDQNIEKEKSTEEIDNTASNLDEEEVDDNLENEAQEGILNDENINAKEGSSKDNDLPSPRSDNNYQEEGESKDSPSDNLLNIEEVDAHVSINKNNQDEEEDVLSDDRTQTAEKQKSPQQSQMDVDAIDTESNKISTNADTLEDDTSKTSDVQDVEMKSVESVEASEKEISVEPSENEKGAQSNEKDKFDDLFENLRQSSDAVVPMETEEGEFDKDNESQDCDKDNESQDCDKDNESQDCDKDNESQDCDKDNESQDCDKDETGEHSTENRDETDNIHDTASQSEPVETAENDIEISESQTETENVQEEAQGESADVCLIPDNDEELTGAEKEQAILARQNAEKEDAEKEQAEKEATEDTVDQDKETQEQDDCQETGDDIPLEPDVIVEIDNTAELPLPTKTLIVSIIHTDQKCIECHEAKSCEFRYKNDETGLYSYVCSQECSDTLIDKERTRFFIRRRKYIVEDLSEPKTELCIVCKEEKSCIYTFKQDEDVIYICSDDCYNLLSKEEPDKLKLKRNSIRVKNLGATPNQIGGTKVTSSEPKIIARSPQEAELAKLDRDASFERRCANCCTSLHLSTENLQWETLDFCNQLCLSKFQYTNGEKCRTCTRLVSQTSLGKYCVRFGFEICQFCCAACLDKYKKSLKNCSYCQKDISTTNEGFLAPVGDNEQFKDFCSQHCMKKYDSLINPNKKSKTEQCSVCNNRKVVQVELALDGRDISFCSNPCFSAFKFVNNIVPDKCYLCSKHFERKSSEHFTIYADNIAQVFCGKICMNMFITQNRKIVFCQWCKVKKYNFDMIEKHLNPNEKVTMCSLNCLLLNGVSLNRIAKQKVKCDYCLYEKNPQYHLTMSDTSMRNFCTYQCVMQFQSQFPSTPLTLDTENIRHGELNQLQEGSRNNLPFPTGLPKRIKSNQSSVQTLQVPLTSTQHTQSTIPIIANITSLASESSARKRNRTRTKNNVEPSYSPSIAQIKQNVSQSRLYESQLIQSKSSVMYAPPKIKVSKKTVGTTTKEPANKTFVVELSPEPKLKFNMNTQCMPLTETIGITCKPQSRDSEIQTDNDLRSKKLIPVPVPIYIPHPTQGFPIPRPIPIPFPFPIPIPIFIPTTKNSAQGIMKEIKKIQDKMPADPYEAELLMMAELVASDKKKEESDDETNDVGYNNDNSYGEDVLQMALKMATEYDEPSSVDLNNISQQSDNDSSNLIYHQMQMNQRNGRGRKRTNPTNVLSRENNVQPIIKKRRSSENPVVEPSQTLPVEKPDANMCLKYTFGVNAWKQWVLTKNSEIERSSIRRKTFKSELLQMTADELNYSLCLFVKEVRKPNGTEYAPDTIYYLVLGIQQYLYENGRIDNIFTDPYYESFTDCLDEVARKFSILYNDSQYIVTRVEEEHLWECKQLGAHSPHVLLSTLMFFNTKHFNLTTVEEHMQLSFSHIMKHWKRNSQGAKQPGSRNVLLRFYPPNSGQADSKKKKVYEQQENEANPLRCPVRLYEFYLSKCPESVKTRNDVFYLQPERSCVPDSPVWYSTQPLSQESLQKMLHRVKMVKEINVALLTI